MRLYLDESIQEKYGFMVVGYVLCREDPQQELAAILNMHRKKEFHACESMKDNSAAQALRASLREYINLKCRWGVIVFPNAARWTLARELGRFMGEIANSVSKGPAVSVFLDERLIKQSEVAIVSKEAAIAGVRLCKSHEVHGIQLADLVSSLCGIRLREELTGEAKILTYGSESGFDPPIEAELGYELWASLRYSMHRCEEPISEYDLAEFSTAGFGFFLSTDCQEWLRGAAEKLFARLYLGCIH